MPRLNGKIVSYTITGTSEADVLTDIFNERNNNRGLTVYITSSTAGTAKVYYIDPFGTSVEVDDQVMGAGDSHVFDFDYPVPQAKVTFAAGSASGTIFVEAVNY